MFLAASCFAIGIEPAHPAFDSDLSRFTCTLVWFIPNLSERDLKASYVSVATLLSQPIILLSSHFDRSCGQVLLSASFRSIFAAN